MIRSVIKLGVLLVIGIISYNYFLGNPEEKAEARETVGKIKDVVGSAFTGGVALLKEEREKFREGKYDKAVDKVSGLIDQIKDKVEGSGGALLEQVKDLEKHKDSIAKRLEDAKATGEGMSDETKKSLTKEFEALTEEAADVLKQMEDENSGN